MENVQSNMTAKLECSSGHSYITPDWLGLASMVIPRLDNSLCSPLKCLAHLVVHSSQGCCNDLFSPDITKNEGPKRSLNWRGGYMFD